MNILNHLHMKQCIYNTRSLNSVPACNWGIIHENSASEEFTKIVKLDHTNFTCKQIGLILMKENPYIGASPDGITSCDCCSKSIIEIKCPFLNILKLD